MTEEKREASEACPDCGRERAESVHEGMGRCKAHLPNLLAPSKCAELTITRLRSELSALRHQLETERHGVWDEGYTAGLGDAVRALADPAEGPHATSNPYAPAEAPVLPVGKETE